MRLPRKEIIALALAWLAPCSLAHGQAGTPKSAAPLGICDSAWNRASTSIKVADFDKFLQSCGDSRHATTARQRRQTIIDQAARDAARSAANTAERQREEVASAQRYTIGGGAVTSTVGGNDPWDDYAVSFTQGVPVEISMTASSFDTYVEVGSGVGRGFSSIASDDDSGDGNNALLRFTPGASGVLTVRARPYSGSGSYSLNVSVAAAAPPQQAAATLALGSGVNGSLATSDARNSDNRPYDSYTVSLRRGQRIQVDFRSTSFDPVAEISRGTSTFSIIGSDDDSGDGNSALLDFTAPESDTYTIRARGYTTDAAGAYTLRVYDGVVFGRQMSVGNSYDGVIETSDLKTAENRPYDLYTFQLSQGERIDLEMKATTFDPILYVSRGTGTFTTIASNDDGGKGVNALLTFVAPAADTYTVFAAALDASGAGAYTLSLLSGSWPSNNSFTGELTNTSAQDEQNRRYQNTFLTLQAGETVTIETSTSVFDPEIQLYYLSGASDTLLASDDDGTGNLNSRIVHTASERGRYAVRVISHNGAVGAYGLSVTRR